MRAHGFEALHRFGGEFFHFGHDLLHPAEARRPGDAFAAHAFFKARRIVRWLIRQIEPVAHIGLGDDVQQHRAILNRAAHRTDMRQRAERRQRIGGDAPEARLQSISVREAGRDADGAAAIGAQRQRAETRGERGGGTAGRSARRLGLVPRIARDAGERRIRAALPAIFRRGGFADQDRARFFQPRDRRRIFIPRAFGIDAVRTAPRGPTLGQQQILHRHRHAIQRR